MNRRRAVWILGLLAILLALLLWQVGAPTPPRRLAHENYPLVRVGMPQAEVEGLLGGPPGNYGRHAGGTAEMTLEGYLAPPGATERIWCDDSNRLEIYFDAEGSVVGHHRRAGYWQSPPEGLVGWLRHATGL